MDRALECVVQMVAQEVARVREDVAMRMLLNGLSVRDGWSIGERVNFDTTAVDHEFWPVRNARVGGRPEEERRDLGLTYRRLL